MLHKTNTLTAFCVSCVLCFTFFNHNSNLSDSRPWWKNSKPTLSVEIKINHFSSLYYSISQKVIYSVLIWLKFRMAEYIWENIFLCRTNNHKTKGLIELINKYKSVFLSLTRKFNWHILNRLDMCSLMSYFCTSLCSESNEFSDVCRYIFKLFVSCKNWKKQSKISVETKQTNFNN